MLPFLDLGFATVSSFNFLLSLGFLTTTGVCLALANRSSLDKIEIFRFLGIFIICGVIGARFIYSIQYALFFNGLPEKTFSLSGGGGAQYGGLIFGIIAFLLYCRYRKLDSSAFADVFAPGFMLMVFFGRIGCFLNGCCFGITCSSLLGITYPKGSQAYSLHLSLGLITEQNLRSLPVYPTQIISALAAFILAIVLLSFFFRKKFKGNLFWLMLAIYALFRLIIGFFRYDDHHMLGLTFTQILSILILFFAIYMFKFKHGSLSTD